MPMRQPDRIDRRILEALRADGRLPVSSIAHMIGLSRTAVRERITRLERDGIIQGYTITTSPDYDGTEPVRAYIMIKMKGALCHKIAPVLSRVPEIDLCESLAGGVDMLIRVNAPDNNTVSDIRDKIARMHEVSEAETLMVLNTRFER